MPPRRRAFRAETVNDREAPGKPPAHTLVELPRGEPRDARLLLSILCAKLRLAILLTEETFGTPGEGHACKSMQLRGDWPPFFVPQVETRPRSRGGGGDRRLSGGHAGPAGRGLFAISDPIQPYHTDLNLDHDPPPYASDFQDIKG